MLDTKISIGRKQGFKNIFVNLFAFLVQLVLSLYVSPIIVSKVGAAANGFVGLAQDFVSYAGLIAIVFNSVASRFIANSYYRGEIKKANEYFSSLLITNVIISTVIGLIGVITIPNLEKFFTIESKLVFDVKLTFGLVFLSYIVTLSTQIFSVSTFVTNRIDIQGIRNIIQYSIRFGLTIGFLIFVSVRIYWISAAMVIANAVIAIMNINLTRKLTPDLRFNVSDVRSSLVKELALSGCWMAISSLSTIMIRGFDLTIANLFLGDYDMGLLSIARTLPNNLTSVVSTLTSTFVPGFIVLYAENNTEGLVKKINSSVKTMSFILFVPIVGFIVYSRDFYSLWQNSLNENEIYIVSLLSNLTVIQTFFYTTSHTLHQIPLVTNKLKISVLASIVTGSLSIVFELLLIKYTPLGIYAIIIATTILLVLQYTIFVPIYSAYCLGEPLSLFYLEQIKTWLLIPVLIGVIIWIKLIVPVHSWLTFIISVSIAGIVGYIIVFIYLYNREILQKIKSYL